MGQRTLTIEKNGGRQTSQPGLLESNDKIELNWMEKNGRDFTQCRGDMSEIH